MASQKSISKSIRLTPELYAYIDGYQGNGFNEKFENIILDAKTSEPARKERLEYMDRRIKDRETLLQIMDRKIGEMLRDVHAITKSWY